MRWRRLRAEVDVQKDPLVSPSEVSADITSRCRRCHLRSLTADVSLLLGFMGSSSSDSTAWSHHTDGSAPCWRRTKNGVTARNAAKTKVDVRIAAPSDDRLLWVSTGIC